MVTFPAGVGGIDEIVCGRRMDWSNFLLEWMGLVKLCEIRVVWSNFLLEWEGLVKHSMGMCKIGQTFCWRGKDWSNFLQGNSFGSRQDWGKHSPVHNAT